MRKVFLGLVAFSIAAMAQTQIKKVPTRWTNPTSGPEMYRAYCASCHGQDGKGNGPAAPALKTPPADLTRLARQNNAKFPADRVLYMVRHVEVSAHGSTEMPVWGTIFREMDTGAQADMRAFNLTKYVESIQEK